MKKYFFYASSILFSRGLEYLVLLIAPLYLSKEHYGSMEFYKKAIELGSAILTFGLPTLMLSYPKSNISKTYFTFLSLLFITLLGIILIPFLWYFNFLFLLVPIYFQSIFFNNGIIPPFILTKKGSNSASIYKVFISLLFYTIVLITLLYSKEPEYAFVYVCYILLPILMLCITYYSYKNSIVLNTLKRYWNLFKKLIISSLTIVVSNFANMMFLYTDILIIKILSNNPEIEIANYSFSLNIANALIIIPMTMVQVDIEKIKNNKSYIKVLRNKILGLIIIMTIVLMMIFVVLTNNYFQDYKSLIYLFLIILGAKVFQAISISYGAVIIIKKMFSQNLKINLFALAVNIILSYLLYSKLGLIGISFSSVLSLIIRFILLVVVDKKSRLRNR